MCVDVFWEVELMLVLVCCVGSLIFDLLFGGEVHR